MKKLGVIFMLILLGGFIIAEEKVDNEVISKIESDNSVEVFIKYSNEDFQYNLTSQVLSEEKIEHQFDGFISANISENDLIKLEENLNIESVTLVGTKNIFLDSSVPLTNATLSWNFKSEGINLTGFGQTVCILDTGVDFTHPDLLNKNLTCVIDCISGSCAPNCTAGDGHGHGTHVAGIIGANGVLKGIAPDVNLIGVQVCNAGGSCSDADIIAGIDWCELNEATYNISVISMSLGGGQFKDYCDDEPSQINYVSSINNAVSKNISVVIATGNIAIGYTNATDGIASPSCIENATRVTASDDSDLMASFAFRYQFFTDILTAPGVYINSTYPGNLYHSSNGTSMSAPHVSGAIAILQQFKNLEKSKSLTPNQSKNSLIENSKLIYDSLTKINYSRINLYNAIISLDETSPSITSYSVSREGMNQTLICNVTDNLILSNITINIWNSTGLFYQNTTTLIGNSAQVEENVTLGDDVYEWNCLSYDYKGNSYTTSNLSISSIISTNLYFPLDDYSTNQNLTFTCNSDTSYELSNVTFYLWNSTNELIYNETKIISGISNSTDFYYNFTYEGNYSWNCLSQNNITNSIFSDSNFSLIFDTTSPNVTLDSPSSGYSSTGAQTISFKYNISDNFYPSNCSLYLNELFVLSNQTPINNNTINEISYYVPHGSYSWNIICFDTTGNLGTSTKRTMTINPVSTSVSSTSSGGGSSSPSSSKIIITENQLQKGVTNQLSIKSEISFNLNNENHSLKITNISSGIVSITIYSNPINLNLREGDIRKLDINDDDFYDIQIYIKNTTSSKVYIELKEIYEKVEIKNIIESSEDNTLSEPKKSFFNKFMELIKLFIKSYFGPKQYGSI
jgi:subtilisin family serine protease